MARLSLNRQITIAMATLTIAVLASCAFRGLSGTVVTTKGDPLPGCTATLEIGTNGGLQKSKTTDSDGFFSFGTLASAGGCAVRFERPGYVTTKVQCPSDGTALCVSLQTTSEAAAVK
jgi:hypothetical protein